MARQFCLPLNHGGEILIEASEGCSSPRRVSTHAVLWSSWYWKNNCCSCHCSSAFRVILLWSVCFCAFKCIVFRLMLYIYFIEKADVVYAIFVLPYLARHLTVSIILI